ncbi:hypothetical protein QA596_09120 [Balneolales bacterium ANBcel1]|nr:hypothetical protein [Balneolales bacterium ANBcel1]
MGVLVLLLAACRSDSSPDVHRPYIDLSGTWQFALDTADTGIAQKWFLSELEDTIQLPGTTDSNRKGFANTDTTTRRLNREYTYEGPAWYRKQVVIPEHFRDQHVRLFIERTKPAAVWVDDTRVGESMLLQSPQIYDLTGVVEPGEHTISIRVDNSLELTPYGNSHIYSNDTQTNWNGMIGEMRIEARPMTYIENLRVYPDIVNRKVDIEISIENPLGIREARIELQAVREENGESTVLERRSVETTLDSLIHLEYYLGDEMRLWDDYEQPLYHLTATLSYGGTRDSDTAVFGMRDFSVSGTQFQINGRTTFLRGKHDGALFPLTGHTPMDVESWERIFQIAQSYGINHYRFHSWSPPEAAFIAADRVGIFLQTELPFWGGLDSDSVAYMLREEGYAMLKHYANHPSFVMFSHGNEIWSGHERVEENIRALRNFDDRPLYTQGSNNNIGYLGPGKSSEFFVASRTPYAHDTTLTHTRLTHAFVDSRDGGILNTRTPSTDIRFDYPVSQIDIPLVTHEIAQYQIYPDYEEIDKYTGVLQPWNLEVFRSRLEKAGMLDQRFDFQRASGALSALCYKEEMEAALRTENLAGFQLLDLQDFPGQGTALVGILDVFMDSKGVVSREEWLQSCNDVVVMLEFPKYTWTGGETFQAKVRVANYSRSDVREDLAWEIRDRQNAVIEKGRLTDVFIPQGSVQTVGEISVILPDGTGAEMLTVDVSLENTPYANSYPAWVYPPADDPLFPGDVKVASRLDDEAFSILDAGGRVLLFPETDDVADVSFPGLFPPDFWNFGMFKRISENAGAPVSPGTLGLLMDPDHPLFNAFPTDFHTNWQWFSIIKESNSLILDDTPDEYRPLVQVIDNLERNHKLGLLFEFSVGEGKLLVCMSQLENITDKPEARQLYHSILKYMNSEAFRPAHSISREELSDLFR